MATGVLCPGCGAVVPDRSIGCPKCGTYLDAEIEPTRISQRMPDPLRGAKLGEYVVQERIGLGGMGIVYRASHPLIGNSVAIKVLRPDVISTEADLQRFLGEAKAINNVRHPGVVSIFGAGDTPDGRKYLVMELLQGESLEARRMREGKLPTSEVVTILEEVLAALVAVHAAGVVHRDLKPANVFLAQQSDGRTYVKLLDFGLARRSNQVEVSRVAGTPDYISPEHAQGRPPGPAADFYSFGVMAFHLLTGRLPFLGNTPVAVMEQHVYEPPPSAGVYDGSIPNEMSELIMKLMAKEPLHRPIAATVRAELKAVSAQLRAASTQRALPAMTGVIPGLAGDRERPTAPGAPQLHLLGGNPSRDTEPSLVAQAPTPNVLGAQGPTPGLAPPPHAAKTTVAAPALHDTVPGTTSPELLRRRWQKRAIAAGALLLAMVAGKAVLDSRAAEEGEPEPPMPAGRRALPNLSELEPEETEVVVPPEPEHAVAEVPVDWKVGLRTRVEAAQKLAHEKKAVTQESAAKKMLARLETAVAGDQADLEKQLAQLESKLGAPK